MPHRGHYERIARSAFDESLKTSDVVFTFNHDKNLVLGRQSSGSLRLGTDDDGLRFEVDLPDTSAGRDVHALVARSDLRGCSFAFIPGEDSWGVAPDGRQVRTHTSVRALIDASVVTHPAYTGTTVALRAAEITTRPPNLRGQLIRARARLLTGGSK